MLKIFLKIILLNVSVIGIYISSLLLIFAISYEYLGGLIPCKMCLWQRWLHVGIILLCFTSIFLYKIKQLILFLTASLSLVSFIVAGWHSGIEIGIFPSPNICLDNSILETKINLKEFLNKSIISCDVILWSFLGLSMASWNTIISFLLSVLYYLATFYKGEIK